MFTPNKYSIFDNMVTSVIVINHSLDVTFYNTAAEQLLALSAKRIGSSHLFDLFHRLSTKPALFTQALSSKQGFTDNLAMMTRQDLSQITVDLCVSPITFQQQAYLLLEFRQVDQQQQISSEMNQHTQQQLAKNLVKGLAHEIKNPLGGLRGAAQLLQRELNQSNREYTQIIIEQADRLNNLVDRLLGPNTFNQYSEHNIHQVLDKVIQLISIDLPTQVTIIRDYDPSIPDVHIDPELIQQALINVIQNAIQAVGEQGKISIITRVVNQVTLKSKRYRLGLEIKIVDDGPGIKDALKSTLFYPMVTGRADGTGLGLSITQTLINQHQGRIDFKSEPSNTQFIITLPISQAKENHE